LAGVLLLTTSNRTATTEEEPNDTVGAPHDLGQVLVGQAITVFGNVDASDPNDGFRLRCPQRAVVTAKITFSDMPANDLDLLVYDPTSLQIVERFPLPASPAQVTFVARATFDVVVAALAGATAYQLDVSLNQVPTALTEHEPNNLPGEGEYAGVLLPGERLTLLGSASPTNDPTDEWLVPFPLAATLQFDFSKPAFNQFDVEVLDGTSDVDNPTLIATIPGLSAAPSPIVGSVVITSGTLVVLRVKALAGNGGSWTLVLRPTAPPPGTPKPGLLAGRPPAPLDLEDGRVPGLRARYGRVDAEVVEGEILVLPRPGQATDASVAGADGTELARVPEGVRRVRVPLAAGLSRDDAARATLGAALSIEGAPGVLAAEPNYRVRAYAEPNDEFYDLQWHYQQINLPQAWNLANDASSVIVAVIDTGITPHLDLTANVIAGYDFISDPSYSEDGDGMDPNPNDAEFHGSFHGTHVAGTIGAVTNNGVGVAGVAWGVRIMPLRVLGWAGGTTFDIASAIRYAARLPNASGQLPSARAHVINMSLGSSQFSSTMADACNAAMTAGVVIVAAAGNDGAGAVGYPAATEGVIAVGATDALARKTSYSNFGSALDIMAPGGDSGQDANGDGYGDGVLSTLWDDFTSPAHAIYEFYDGTSMASPHVAGVVALMLAENPTLTRTEVFTKITTTARDMGATGRDNSTGWGLVDAYQAVLSVQQGPPPPTTPPNLHLDLLLVDLGAAGSERELALKNLGDDPLLVNLQSVTTQDGNPWLTASLEGPAFDDINFSVLRLQVDRTGLPPGGYEGAVTLGSNGGSKTVRVKMAVVPDLPPLPVIPLRLFVKSAQTGEIVRFVDVDANRSYQWDIPSLPLGQYFILAGTDLDRDGNYDDDGEFVGAWPSFDQPHFIEVGLNQTVIGIRLNVFPRTSLDPFTSR
jgi:subtilisin family serine protease